MLNYRPKMFDEAAGSHTSKNIFKIIISFILVFIVILILETIPPAIISWRAMKEEMARLSADGFSGNEWELSMKASQIVSMDPKIMVPTLFSTIFGTLAAIFYCRCIELRPVHSMGARKKGIFGSYFLGLLIGAALMSVIVLLSSVTGASSTSACKNVNYFVIAMFFLGFVVQGMSEEFIFRGYLMTTIGGSGHHTALAVGISSVGFALAHATNPGFGLVPFINLTLFGAFAALYMILFDNIWGVSAIHSMWNFTQGNLYGISVSGSGDTESVFRTAAVSSKDYITGGEFGIEGSLFTTIALGIGVAAVLAALYKKSSAASKAAQPQA